MGGPALNAVARWHRSRWSTVTAFQFLAVGALGAEAQEPLHSRGEAVSWRVNRAGDPGVLSGLVLTDHGTPFEGALVFVDGHASTTARTDEDGRFTMTPPKAGEWLVRIMGGTTVEVSETLLIPHDRGVFLVAILQSWRRGHLCDGFACLGKDCDDLNVEVLDDETGLAPEGEVTLRLEQAGQFWENHTVLEPLSLPNIGLGRRVESRGKHSIVIRAEGYEEWRVDDIHLELVPGCTDHLLNRDHVARLKRSGPDA